MEQLIILFAKVEEASILKYLKELDITTRNNLIKFKNKQGEMLIHLAAKNGCLSVVEYLLTQSAVMEESSPFRELVKTSKELFGYFEGGSNIPFAIAKIKERIKKIGPYVNVRHTETGNTPLHFSILNKQKGIVEILIKKDPNVLIKNRDGLDALTLLQKTYPDEINLLALAHQLAFNKLKENFSLQTVECTTVSGVSFENKESKEIRESSKDKMVLSKENNEMFMKCLESLDLCVLSKINNDSKVHELLMDIGILLSDPKSNFYSPVYAYKTLSYIVQSMNAVNLFYSEPHKMMLALLCSGHILFDMDEIEPKLIPVTIELDGQKTQESKLAYEHRLLCTIHHFLYSKNEDQTQLGKYIADYVQGSDVIDVKALQGKPVESQLALIQMFKKQRNMSQNIDKELKEKEERIKFLEEKLKKMNLERQKKKEELAHSAGLLTPKINRGKHE